MADFEITAPDGRRFVITAPEGASQDEVLRYAQSNMPAAPAPERGLGERVAGVAGQFGAGVNRGIAQVIGGPFDLANRGLRAAGVPIPEGSVTGTVQRGINAVVGEPAAPQGTVETLARGAGNGLVDAATIALPAAGLARVTQVANAAPSLTNRAATALASQPGLQVASGMAGGGVGEATDSPMLGAAAALATPLAAGGAGRLITPVRTAANPQRAALVAAADAEGIPLTAGQATNNRFLQNVESQLEQLPLTAGPQRAIREEQQRAFTSAALRRAGTEADNAGPEVLNDTRQRIGAQFDDLTARNSLQLDDDAMQAMAALEARLMADDIPGVRGPALARMREVVAQVGEDGTVPGTFYRQMDTALGSTMRGTSSGDLRTALGEVRDTLRAAMDRSISPEDAAAWQQARRQYANFKVAERATSGAGASVAEGQISPAALRGAVNTSTGGGYALGRGDLNQLARVGQGVVRAPPDSGTAGRSMAQQLLTGGAMATGSGAGAMAGGLPGAIVGGLAPIITPRIVQALMNTPQGQAYLRNQVVQNPALTRNLAAALVGQQGVSQAVSGP